jgi:hypothetical protein
VEMTELSVEKCRRYGGRSHVRAEPSAAVARKWTRYRRPTARNVYSQK